MANQVLFAVALVLVVVGLVQTRVALVIGGLVVVLLAMTVFRNRLWTGIFLGGLVGTAIPLAVAWLIITGWTRVAGFTDWEAEVMIWASTFIFGVPMGALIGCVAGALIARRISSGDPQMEGGGDV